MSKSSLKHKINTILKLSDTINTKYQTIKSYFMNILRAKKKGKPPQEFLTLVSNTLYPEIVDVSNDIMYSEDQYINLIDELMTDHIRELTGKDIEKILKKYKQHVSSIKSFFTLIKFRPGMPAEESFKIDLPGATAPSPKLVKQNVYDMLQKSRETVVLMQDFEKLLSIKGRGIEQSEYGGRADIPRKYM